MRDFRDDVADLIRRNLPPPARMIDLGAGYGDMAKRLYKDYSVDAVEAYEPYVHQFNLQQYYGQITAADVIDYELPPHVYDVALALEIVEHMSEEVATRWLCRLIATTKQVIVTVPYMYPQGPAHGNEWQRHVQDDLTREVFLGRYPFMTHVSDHHIHDAFYGGIFISNASWI